LQLAAAAATVSMAVFHLELFSAAASNAVAIAERFRDKRFGSLTSDEIFGLFPTMT
jgi:hypothetical protein